jgi:hypothetical protein
MAAQSKHPPGPAMTLDNMRHLGVQRLVATCLNDACRHQGLIDLSKYPGDTEVPWFARKVVCAKCGARRRQKHQRPPKEATAIRPIRKTTIPTNNEMVFSFS